MPDESLPHPGHGTGTGTSPGPASARAPHASQHTSPHSAVPRSEHTPAQVPAPASAYATPPHAAARPHPATGVAAAAVRRPPPGSVAGPVATAGPVADAPPVAVAPLGVPAAPAVPATLATSPAPPVPPAQPAPTRLRVVIADDNPVVRAGLTALLDGRDDIHVVGEAADGHQTLATVAHHRPDVVLLDVRMPGIDGLSALPHLVRLAPVMMLTYSRERAVVEESLRLGAGGYLVHGEFSAEQLATAVRDVTEGRAHFTTSAQDALLAHVRATSVPWGPDVSNPYELNQSTSHLQPAVGQSQTTRRENRQRHRLSSREAEVMELIATGMNNQQIAATCFISEKTVKNHINRIFAKLHATNRSEATAVWLGVTPMSETGRG